MEKPGNTTFPEMYYELHLIEVLMLIRWQNKTLWDFDPGSKLAQVALG